MLTPRYIYSDDFQQFYSYFLSQPHEKKIFHKGDYLWKTGEPFDRIHYIISGAEMHYAYHESGRRKIISFHTAGTIFPVYKQNDYKIELSLETVAISEMKVLEFTKDQFQKMFETNTELSEQIVNWYSMYVNRFLFETVHQEYNSSFDKICNLLYLLISNQPSQSGLSIDITQDELAELLGLSRIQLARGLAQLREHNIISTSRSRITVNDLPSLAKLCTSETL